MSTTPTNGSKAKTMALADLGKKPGSVTVLSDFLGKMKSQLEMALPKHMNVDRVTRLVCTEFSRNPKLQECTLKSIVGAVMTASQFGWEIGVGGQAYIVPYKTTATLVPGWKGLIDLVARAGRAAVWTGAVFEGDEFDWQLGDSPFLRHRPMGENDPDKMLYAYAIGKVNGSNCPIIECWPNDRIRKHFKKNVVAQLQEAHYSNKHWEMYARKVVLLQVLKYLPQSIELVAASDLSDSHEQGKPMTIDANFIPIDTEEPDEQVDEPTKDDTKPESKDTSGGLRHPDGSVIKE